VYEQIEIQIRGIEIQENLAAGISIKGEKLVLAPVSILLVPVFS
jgi:hypothetical protein